MRILETIVYLVIEKFLYATLVRIGLDVEHPQEFAISRIPNERGMTLDLHRKEEGVLTIFVCSYRVTEGHEPLPEPPEPKVVVLQVIPGKRRARIISCKWPTSRDVPSLGLHFRIRSWLQKQLALGLNLRCPIVIQGSSCLHA